MNKDILRVAVAYVRMMELKGLLGSDDIGLATKAKTRDNLAFFSGGVIRHRSISILECWGVLGELGRLQLALPDGVE